MAFAVVAAASGISFSSGRQIVLFFSQTGWCSWIGVCCSAALFGLLCAGACRLKRETGERGFTGACTRAFGLRLGKTAGALYALLNLMMAASMLHTAGRAAMLLLPVRNARLTGVLSALAAALWINMHDMRRLPGMGFLTTALCVSFHICLALDPRPAPIIQSYVTRAELSGSVTAAVCLAALHGALGGAAAAGTVLRFADGGMQPVRFGAECGALMLLALAAANGAVLSGGERLLSLALPTVVLAARWGKAGYFLCLTVMGLCAVATLSAAMGMIGAESAADLNPMKTSADHDKKTC